MLPIDLDKLEKAARLARIALNMLQTAHDLRATEHHAMVKTSIANAGAVLAEAGALISELTHHHSEQN
jgi:hypothetical protein